jgi:hypothetical protein
MIGVKSQCDLYTSGSTSFSTTVSWTKERVNPKALSHSFSLAPRMQRRDIDVGHFINNKHCIANKTIVTGLFVDRQAYTKKNNNHVWVMYLTSESRIQASCAPY